MDEQLKNTILAKAHAIAVAPPGPRKHPVSHPDQVKGFNEAARAEGFTGVHYHRDGTVTFADRTQYKRYAESRGYYAQNGGHGDPQPHNIT
jgi:hypothetical protein